MNATSAACCDDDDDDDDEDGEAADMEGTHILTRDSSYTFTRSDNSHYVPCLSEPRQLPRYLYCSWTHVVLSEYEESGLLETDEVNRSERYNISLIVWSDATGTTVLHMVFLSCL